MSINKKIIETEASEPIENFNIVTATGTGTTQTISGLGFQPDLIWGKQRNQVNNHFIADSSRPGTGILTPNSNSDEYTIGNYGYVSAYNTDGFTMTGGSGGITNPSGIDMVYWCWRANEGSTSSNTNGTITSTVQANTNAGFSIVKYTGNGTSGATIGHGLSVAPDLLIFKRLNASESWNVWSSSVSSKVGFLNLTNAFINYSVLGTSTSTITLNDGTGHNASGSPYICYAFASTDSFSKFGSYSGNGSGSGQTITTGFQPDWIILKSTSVGSEWVIVDSVRGDAYLSAESSAAEVSPYTAVDFLSTGFKLTGTSYNESGRTFIYMTFKIN